MNANPSTTTASALMAPRIFVPTLTPRGRVLQEVSPRDVSRMTSALRNRALSEGMGPDDVKLPVLYSIDGRKIGKVSWNSKVWIGDACVYEPTISDLEVAA